MRSSDPMLPVLTVESTRRRLPSSSTANRNPWRCTCSASRRPIARTLIDRIPSGGAVINHVAMHCLVPQLPFGGVGASGMGAYHGRWGFESDQPPPRGAGQAGPTRPDGWSTRRTPTGHWRSSGNFSENGYDLVRRVRRRSAEQYCVGAGEVEDCGLSSSRSAMTTLAPSAAKRRGVANPMPEAPPMTTATRP